MRSNQVYNKSRLNNEIVSNIQICSRENHTIHELSIHVVVVHNIMYTVHIFVNVIDFKNSHLIIISVT
jgi:hypothetical protein